VKKNKIYLYLFTVIVLAAIFLSCSENTDSTQTTDKTEEDIVTEVTEEIDPLEALKPDIPELNFDGYEFTVISRDDGTHGYPLHTRDIFAELETGNTINDAVYRRNIEIEEKFNIKIAIITLPETDSEETANNMIKNAVIAGEDLYDLVYTHALYGATTAAAGYLLNWNTLPYVDVSKPWWCEGAIQGLSVGDKLFLALSDASVSSTQYAYMVYFNKDMQKEYNVANIYQMVGSGQWTFDKISEVTKGVTTDLNGDGIMDNEDKYGAIISYAALNFFYAGGNTVMAKDSDNMPYLDITSERAANTFEKAYDICHSDYVRFAPGWEDEVEMMQMFESNKALLYFHSLSKIDRLRDMDYDFGVLPYPKLDESQEKYYTYVDGHSPLLAVPKVASNLERTGAIIEELSYLSRKYLLPAYYDVTLKTKFARDEESAEMLDYIINGRVYDFGYVYDGTTAYIFQSQINAKNREFISAIEKRMDAAQKNLDKIITAYSEAVG